MSDSEVELSRIDPVSLAKISGAVYGLIAAVFGLLYLPFVLIGGISSLGSSAGAVSAFSGLFGGLFLVAFMIVLYAVLGAVLGAIMGFVYNFAASKIGGIEFEYRETE